MGLLPADTTCGPPVEGHGFVLNSIVSWKSNDLCQGQSGRPVVPFADETQHQQILIDGLFCFVFVCFFVLFSLKQHI